MRILQLCNKMPQPAIDGGCIAMNNLTQGLINVGIDVQVLAMSTHKHPAIAGKITNKDIIQWVQVDTRVKQLDAFFNLFKNESYNISRFKSVNFENKLISMLKSAPFDVIQLESLFMTPYIETIRKYSKARIVLRSHNIEYRVWERLAEKSPVHKRWYIRLLAARLKTYELFVLNKVDAIACITPNDLESYKLLNCTVPLITIPFGIDVNAIAFSDQAPKEFSLFHIGSMDWLPNDEAIRWFVNEVWPSVHKEFPEIKLHLAGRNMQPWLRELKMKNIVVHGEIADALSFMKIHGAMIVPIRSAGGMRIKIIEGMAIGKPIITTTIGAEGIPCENNKQVFIANGAEQFVRAIRICLTDNDKRLSIVKNARELVEHEFDNKQIAFKLEQFYQTLINA